MSPSIVYRVLIGKSMCVWFRMPQPCLVKKLGKCPPFQTWEEGPRRSMRHPHHCTYSFSSGKHRSGFFVILLMFFLSEVRGRPADERLQMAMDVYFSRHPLFSPQDRNEELVTTLVWKNVGEKNWHEFLQLMASMDEEPLYQQILTKLPKLKKQPPSVSPPWRRRSRSPVRLLPGPFAKEVEPKAKKMPKGSVAQSMVPSPPPYPPLRPSKKMPKGSVGQSMVPGPSRAAVSLVPGPSGAASSSSASELDDPTPDESEGSWQTDSHEWVQRDCWVCQACHSMNLRFTQWCTCGAQRQWEEGWKWQPRNDDWVCDVCGNRNFKWRERCNWSDCPTADWTCECGNVNWGRRRFCNLKTCQKPRP